MTDTTTTTEPQTTDAPVDNAVATPEAEAPKVDQQADPAKEGEQPKAEGEQPKTESESPAGAPEQYADFTAPEGVALNEAVLGELRDVAKEMNLSQEQAQKVVDLGVKLQQNWAAQSEEQYEAQLAEWRTASESDPRFGGSPEKLGEHLAVAKAAYDKFATPAFKEQIIEGMGLGNHPEIIHVFSEIGKAMAEDGVVSAQQQASGDRVLGQSFYSNSNMTR